jgi:thioredoxin 1
MKLDTKLTHLETASEWQKVISENENVMVCCGRMGPMCIPVYGVMEELEPTNKHIKFADMAFDSPESHVIKNVPEVRGFMGIPFVMYYKNGKLVKATSSIQSMKQVKENLETLFQMVIA